MELKARHLKAGYDKNVIIEDMTVPAHKVTALIGANGCGKSTLLKTLCRIQPPLGGEVLLDGRSIFAEDSRQLAKKLAILPQNPQAPAGLTVRELVNYGRAPHRARFFARTTNEDRRMVDWALQETDMAAFADRPLEARAGGQRQRAWIAMAIAQDTELLFLDEPTSFLDVAHQLDVLTLVRHLNSAYGKTIVMVIHEVNEAARFADHLLAMKQGQLLYEGAPDEVFTEAMLADVFGMAHSSRSACATRAPAARTASRTGAPRQVRRSPMRKRFLNWGLLAILAVLSLALGGCGSQAVSGNSKGAAAFDAETLRADTPEAIDEELAARFERTKKAADRKASPTSPSTRRRRPSTLRPSNR